MTEKEPQGNISQLTGLMGFIHRSGALAPFQVMMIITGVIFALSAYQHEKAWKQPLCFWVLCLFALEILFTLITGLILAWRRPDCLMTEMFQQAIKEMDAKQKEEVSSPGIDVDTSDESDSGSQKV